MADKEFNNVQLFVEYDSTVTTRQELATTKENVAYALSKVKKWYPSLVPTGGSSGQILEWNSSGTAKWVNKSDYKVKQTPSTDSNYHPLLIGYPNSSTRGFTPTDVTDQAYTNTNLFVKPDTGTFYAAGYFRTDITSGTLDLNTITLSDGNTHIKRYIERTDGGSTNISNMPITGKPFLLEVELIRWASATDYITRQLFTNANNPANQYVRYCTNGTWGAWTTRVFTDTKVTSAANHYAPATAAGQDKTASASGATAAWSIDVVKGVTLNTDGKGHVTGISVTSGKIPANPVPSNNVTGSGTSGYLTKWNGTNTITNGPQLGSDTTMFLRNDGSWATPPNTLYSAGTGLTLDGTTFNHTNSITAQADSFVFKKIKYDAQGHITDVDDVTASDLPSHTHLYAGSASAGGPATQIATTVTNGTTTLTRYGIVFVDDPAVSEGNAARKNNDFRVNFLNGTTSSAGYTELVLGNNKTSTTADNKYGMLTLYSPGANLGFFKTDTLSENRTYTFPNKTGTVALTSDIVTYSAGTGLSLSGTTFNHSNSVTAKTKWDKQYFKYDAQGHITDCNYFIHQASGTSGTAGWIKIATITIAGTYTNQPLMFTIVQRGIIAYRLHVRWKNVNGTDPGLDEFLLTSDHLYGSVSARAYIIKSATSTWDLYVKKTEGYDSAYITSVEYNGRVNDDSMVITWTNVQASDEDMTGGTEATKKVYATSDQLGNYLPLSGGTITNSEWQAFKIKRTSTQSAGVHFENNNGYLGAVGMNTVNGPLMRWNTDSTTSYNILDTSSTSFTQVLSSGTKIGTIKIDGTSTDIFAPSDTDIHVRQNVSTSTDSYPVLLGAYHTASPTTAFSPTQTTDESYLTDKMWLQPSTGRLTTKGDIIFYSPDSNPTPGIYFRRGSYTDSTLDWRIYNNAGLLTFERTVEGETQSWQTKVQFKGDGIYYENTKLEGDTKVSQSASTTANYRPIVLGYTSTTTPSSLAGTVTNQVYVTTNMYAQPSTGTIYSTYFRGTIYKDGGTWIQDRDTAPVYVNKENSGQVKYYPIGFAKSKDGGWSIGSLGSDNNFYVIYTTDANYSTSTNQKVEIRFPTTDGTLALTSDIPAIAASSNNGYLSVNSTDILVYSTGLAHTKFNQAAENVTTDAWATVGVDPAGRGYILKSLRYNTNYPVWAYAHCAGIVFGGQDTKGMINMSYSTPAITFAGGNHSESKTAPVWYMKITGTSGATYNLANFVTTDTKNTAGSTDTSSKIYLIGATTQAANPQTYSQDTAYVGTDGHVYSNSKQVVNLSDTQALTNKTYNGYTLAAACAKAVVTSIDTSASLPTSNAVKTFVEGKGYVTTDTKNTAGSTDTSSKIFLIGATSQAANPQTYSDNEVYTTSGVLTTKSVQVGGGSCTMQYNSTTQSLDFVFA